MANQVFRVGQGRGNGLGFAADSSLGFVDFGTKNARRVLQ